MSEQELLNLVRQKDNEALISLCEQYQPLILGVQKRYQLRYYDFDDWRQEAMLVCYETALVYDEKKLMSFGSFFKLRLYNHARSLLRYQLAARRAQDAKAASYEAAVAAGLPEPMSQDAIGEQPWQEAYQACWGHLSERERAALLVQIGRLSKEEAKSRTACTETQLQQAQQRCKRKLRAELLD